MDKWTEMRQVINNLTCTTRLKSEHKHNSYEFKKVADFCASILTAGGASALQFEILVEDYIKAANNDYELYTGKKLTELAHRAKRNLLNLVKDYYLDSIRGI